MNLQMLNAAGIGMPSPDRCGAGAQQHGTGKALGAASSAPKGGGTPSLPTSGVVGGPSEAGACVGGPTPSHISPVKRISREGHRRSPSGFTFINMDDSLEGALGDSVVDVAMSAGERGKSYTPLKCGNMYGC